MILLTVHLLAVHTFGDIADCTISIANVVFLCRVIETHSIMSFTLSKSGRHAILNVATQVCSPGWVVMSDYHHVVHY